MKQILAVVKPYLAEKVLEGLKRAPLQALSVREVKGYGRQKNYLDQYADSEYSLAFLPKVEICLWVEDSRAEETLHRIVEMARTGRMGDGKIFVLPAEPAEMVIDIADKDVSVHNIPGPLGVRGRNSDNNLIKEKLGWAPSQTLREGMEKTYAWIATEAKKRDNQK